MDRAVLKRPTGTQSGVGRPLNFSLGDRHRVWGVSQPGENWRDRPGQALAVAVAFGAIFGIGLLVLSRFVAETRDASLILGGVWALAVVLGALAAIQARPHLRTPIAGAVAVSLVGAVAVGWWTGFRDTEVDEDVLVAAPAQADRVADSKRTGSGSPSAGDGRRGEAKGADQKPKPAKPVSIAEGDFFGVDGHDGVGRAEVIEDTDGSRKLVFTGFDVDPGPGIEVYLTRNESEISDRVELGSLKGTVGDQQYDVPSEADLRAYDTVVLYCVPFTVRVAVAPIG